MITSWWRFFPLFLFLAILMAISPVAAQKSSKKVLAADQAEALPRPQRGHGHATGIMLHNGRKELGVPIFLLPKGGGAISKTPATKTDQDGNWAILNVKPGDYCVLGKKPSGQFFIDETSFLEVKAGKVTDFGAKDFKGDLK